MGLNKNVDYSTAKLLKEKGFDLPVVNNYGKKGELGHIIDLALDLEMIKDTRAENFNKYVGTYRQVSAPTIAEVVMWLYEKHGIWIVILPELLNGTEIRYYPSVFEQGIGEDIESYFTTPTEAYQESITYTLKNLI